MDMSHQLPPQTTTELKDTSSHIGGKKKEETEIEQAGDRSSRVLICQY